MFFNKILSDKPRTVGRMYFVVLSHFSLATIIFDELNGVIKSFFKEACSLLNKTGTLKAGKFEE